MSEQVRATFHVAARGAIRPQADKEPLTQQPPESYLPWDPFSSILYVA